MLIRVFVVRVMILDTSTFDDEGGDTDDDNDDDKDDDTDGGDGGDDGDDSAVILADDVGQS